MRTEQDMDGYPEACNGLGVAKATTKDTAGEPKTLGGRIRATRLERGMTAVALAESVGARPHSVWRWESGKLTPRPKTLIAIAHVLGVEPAWLMHGEGGAATAVDASSAGSAWREFEATGGASFYKARGVTEEQLEHVRRMPWAQPPAVSDYVRVLEAIAAGSKRDE